MRYNKAADIKMWEIVTETDSVCNKTKLRFRFVSAALLIAGIKIQLVGIVLIKIKVASTTVSEFTLKQNKAVRADTHKT